MSNKPDPQVLETAIAAASNAHTADLTQIKTDVSQLKTDVAEILRLLRDRNGGSGL